MLKFYGITEFIGGLLKVSEVRRSLIIRVGGENIIKYMISELLDNAHSRINLALKFIAYKYGKSQKKLL